MNLITIIYYGIDPILVTVGPLKIYWYGFLYSLGIFLAWKFVSRQLIKYPVKGLDSNLVEKWLTYIIIGVILGARLGYILFYDLFYYINKPLEVFKFWNGGMSFHGGLCGCIIAIIFLSRIKKNFFLISDLVSIGSPIGLFFGRIANFINNEHIGNPTNVPWAITYPLLKETRHPSQIYEAIGEGLIILIILNRLWKKSFYRENHGQISGLFLFMYGIIRIFIEFFRTPDMLIKVSNISTITIGQLLSIPMVFTGVYIIYYARYQKK